MLLTLQVLILSLRHIPWPHVFGQAANGPAAIGQTGVQIPQAQQEVGKAEDTTPLSIEEMHGPADSGAVENDEI